MDSLGPLGGATPEHIGPIAAAEVTGWYVVETKRHREQVAHAFLSRRGLTAYSPRIVQWPRPAVGGEVGPMFPGYIFVHATLPNQYYRVVWTPGVKTFVTFGEAPVAVDSRIVEFLRNRESPDGVIRSVGIAEKSEVRIVNGPFRGLTAVVEQRLAARERVRVLMHILQRETSVELPDRWVRQA